MVYNMSKMKQSFISAVPAYTAGRGARGENPGPQVQKDLPFEAFP